MMNDLSRVFPWTKRSRVLVLAGVLWISVAAIILTADGSRRAEVDRLARLLELQDGTAVAEIGAGTGRLTVEVAKRVGPSGRVYSTELSAPRLDNIRDAVTNAGLINVTLIEGGEHTTHLSPRLL
jgi:tRNA A58 N-methylase Trm61